MCVGICVCVHACMRAPPQLRLLPPPQPANRRLSPLVDWEKAAQAELQELGCRPQALLTQPRSLPAPSNSRLSPLVDWEKAAQAELQELGCRLTDQGALLHLACAERDGLLRENDKIIAHYKKVCVGEWRTTAWGCSAMQHPLPICLSLLHHSRAVHKEMTRSPCITRGAGRPACLQP